MANATDSLVQLADQFQLDLSRVITVGHSAGGHLGIWLASRHKMPPKTAFYAANPLPIAAVVSLAGIPDMEKAVAKNICRGAAQELLAGMPHEVPAHYATASLPNAKSQRSIFTLHEKRHSLDKNGVVSDKCDEQGNVWP